MREREKGNGFSVHQSSWTNAASILVRQLHEGILQGVSLGKTQEIRPTTAVARCSPRRPDFVVGPGGDGLLERRRLLTVCMAAATVVAHLAGANLMPSLGHVDDHAVVVERLERPGDIGRHLGQEARVGIEAAMAAAGGTTVGNGIVGKTDALMMIRDVKSLAERAGSSRNWLKRWRGDADVQWIDVTGVGFIKLAPARPMPGCICHGAAYGPPPCRICVRTHKSLQEAVFEL
jgi:hypothetical protein